MPYANHPQITTLRHNVDGIASLTPRETQVMRLIASGVWHNKIIARQLGVSDATANLHRQNMKRKLGAKNLAEVIRRVAIAEYVLAKAARRAAVHAVRREQRSVAS